MGEAQSYDGVTVESLARNAGVEAFVRVQPRGSRAEAFAFLARAAMLVVLPQDSTMAVPAKLFDYMQFDAAVLALASAESATAQLLDWDERRRRRPVRHRRDRSDHCSALRGIRRGPAAAPVGGHRGLSREDAERASCSTYLDEVAAIRRSGRRGAESRRSGSGKQPRARSSRPKW